jgi:hypothetical protein
VLPLVCALFLVITMVSVTTWTVDRRRGLPFPVWRVGVSLAVVLTCAVPVVRHLMLERRLSQAAGRLVGDRVGITCQTLSQSWLDTHAELGYVRIDARGRPERRATIALNACRDLTSWLRSDHRHPSEAQVIAVHVLTHEAMHMKGILEEDLAECAAMQEDRRTALFLGATDLQARTLATRYWSEVYPRMPGSYRSAECRAGGALDRGGPDAPWRLEERDGPRVVPQRERSRSRVV